MTYYPIAAKSLNDSWLTIKLLSQAEPAFSQSALRYLVFNAADRQSSNGPILGNGLAPHIRRVGAKVLLNHGGFLSWIDGSAHCATDQLDRGGAARREEGQTTHGSGGAPERALDAENTGSTKRKVKEGGINKASLKGVP